MGENNESLLIEMLKSLNKSFSMLLKLFVAALAVIVILVAGLIGTSIYHDYQWSQFDRVIVDSEDGGNANYVGGDNFGGIYNGEGSGTPQEANQ